MFLQALRNTCRGGGGSAGAGFGQDWVTAWNVYKKSEATKILCPVENFFKNFVPAMDKSANIASAKGTKFFAEYNYYHFK